MTEHDHLARLEAARDCMKVSSNPVDGLMIDSLAWAVKTIRELQAAEKLRESVREYASDGEQRGGAGLLLEYHDQAEEAKRLRARWEWFFGMTDKRNALDGYMTGVTKGWTVEQWNAWADAEIARAALAQKGDRG